MSQQWIELGEVSLPLLGMQTQYSAAYVESLGEGLRFRGEGGTELDLTNYHFIEIHKDDVEVFVSRVKEFRQKLGIWHLDS